MREELQVMIRQGGMRRLFRGLWERWKAFAHILGNFQARIILSVLYFVLISLPALGLKAFSDPLQLKASPPSTWIPREAKAASLEEARRQS